MKTRKIPMRMCVGCREMKEKKALLRIVRSAQGEISFDRIGKAPGRGAYICKSKDCLTKAVRQRQLDRALETKIDEAVLNQLMLGIAMRAGQLSLGESGVLKAISSGAALFMILDAGASDNTKKKFRDSCAFYQVPLYETTPDRLGSAIGKPGRMSAAIARGSLGGKLLALAKEEETGDAPSQGR